MIEHDLKPFSRGFANQVKNNATLIHVLFTHAFSVLWSIFSSLSWLIFWLNNLDNLAISKLYGVYVAGN